MSSGKLQKVSPQIAASLNLCDHNRTTAPGFRAPKPYKYSLQTTGDKKKLYNLGKFGDLQPQCISISGGTLHRNAVKPRQTVGLFVGLSGARRRIKNQHVADTHPDDLLWNKCQWTVD